MTIDNKSDNKSLIEIIDYEREKVYQLTAENQKLTEENGIMREALLFYACEENTTNELYFDDCVNAIYEKNGGWNIVTLVGIFGSLTKKGILRFSQTDSEYGRLYYWNMMVYHEDVPAEFHLKNADEIETWLISPNRKTAIELQMECA